MTRPRDVALVGLVLVVAACTSGSGESTTSSTVGTSTTTTVVATTTSTIASRVDGRLVIGVLLPSPDAEPELAAALAAGVTLAIEDITGAGGSIDNPVELVQSQMVAPGGEAALAGFGELVDARADVIIGAPRSAESEAIIPPAAEEGVVLISPTNSDPSIEEADTTGVFFRTATSDGLQGAALARLLIQAGVGDSVLVLHRQDAFGNAIAQRFQTDFVELGGAEPTLVGYDPDAAGATAERAVADRSPSTVVLVTLDEAGTILDILRETGVSIWLSEPAFGIAGGMVDDPATLAGVQGLIHLPFPDMPQEFLDRLRETPQQPAVLTYAAEAYDALVVAALAAASAGSDDPIAVASAIPDVTRGGETCDSYSACVEMLGEGVDIDYDGIAGPYEMSDTGDPTVATYEWSRYDENGEIQAPLGSITVGE